MQIKHKAPHLIEGIGSLAIGIKNFNPSPDDIKDICRFFPIGKLLHYKIEKAVSFPHANSFVFAATSQGSYMLKFYPLEAAKKIAFEYAVNRILTRHHFQIPIMHTGRNSQPFFTSNDLLVACYSYINGPSAWEHIQQRETIHQINAALFSLKNILSVNNNVGRILLQKQVSLTTTIRELTKDSRSLAPYEHKEKIDKFLLKASRTYQQYQVLFKRQLIHNDVNLTNFLIYKKRVYTLDLEHVQEDYILSDLASLVTSCILSKPSTTIKAIVKDYFRQHKIDPKHAIVLNTLVEIRLIREYLKIIQRIKSLDPAAYPPDAVKIYLSNLAIQNKAIISIFKKMNTGPEVLNFC